MNESSSADDDLDARLRAHFSAPALPDGGFSQRVVGALPTTGRRSFVFSRQFFCSAGLVAGMLCASIGLIGSETLGSALKILDASVTMTLGQVVTEPVALALGLAILSLAFAFREQRHPLLRL